MKIYAIMDGVEYDLNYGDPAKFEGEDDLGMPDLHRMEERGPMQHGTTDRGYRLDPRYPTYVFGITGKAGHNYGTGGQRSCEYSDPAGRSR